MDKQAAFPGGSFSCYLDCNTFGTGHIPSDVDGTGTPRFLDDTTNTSSFLGLGALAQGWNWFCARASLGRAYDDGIRIN